MQQNKWGELTACLSFCPHDLSMCFNFPGQMIQSDFKPEEIAEILFSHSFLLLSQKINS